MNPTNNGSFGAAIGGADPLQQAAAARAMGQAGATSAVSPTAPTYNPIAQAPAGGMPQTGASMGAAPQAQPQIPFETPESQLLIKALDNRLKSISKQEELKANGGVPSF